MLAQYLDVTSELLSNNQSIIETSNYDYCLIQIAGNTGATYLFYSTIDSGAIQSVSDGSAVSSQYYVSSVAKNLTTGAPETGNGGSDGIWRFDVVGRYLKLAFDSGSQSGVKVLVMLAKIS